MSWSDPCCECGNHRADCICEIEPYTQEQLDRFEEERLQRIEAAKICTKKGHDWQYVFIVYSCKRCGETSEY